MKISDFDASEILSGLKDFQIRSAENAFKKLYGSESRSRFLIADEVGLGKTLVCKGLIAKAVEHLRERFNGQEKTIDIIYICSNLDIADQNIKKLSIFEDSDQLASRITLIPLVFADRKRNRKTDASLDVRFLSFTPSTSFDLKNASGWKKERALIYVLLSKIWESANDGNAKRFFRASAGETWLDYLDYYISHWRDLDFEPFLSEFEREINSNNRFKTEFDELKGFFPRIDSRPTKDIRNRQSLLIGEFRQILAEVCLRNMDPDIVIMDEFQRFKSLLSEENETGKLAHRLFNVPNVKTILLSATPYKMYTMRDGEDENHFSDFLETTSWLLNDDLQLEELKKGLYGFRASVFRDGEIDFDTAIEQKKKVEAILKGIMSRFERVGVTGQNDGMIKSHSLRTIPESDELQAYVAIENIAKSFGEKANVEYWKSSPYLFNIMESYQVKVKLKEKLKLKAVQEAISSNQSVLIPRDKLQKIEGVEERNHRLSAISNKVFEQDSWKLLWVPPSAPYYSLEGVFSGFNDQRFTKSLVFSSWKVVPRAISTILSLNAEAKVLEFGPYNGVEQYKNSTRLPLVQDDPSSLRTFSLLYPSRVLTKTVDTFELSKLGNNLKEIKSKAKEAIRPLIDAIGESQSTEKEDQNWYWAAPLLLDRGSEYFEDIIEWLPLMEEIPGARNKGFHWARREFENVLKEGISLGKKPKDLLDVLVDLAIGSSANIAARTFLRNSKENAENKKKTEEAIYFAAAKIAFSFRSLFSSNDAISILEGAYSQTATEKGGDAYWKKVLYYSADGCLQAVMDEYIHVLKEDQGYFAGYECKDEDVDGEIEEADDFMDIIDVVDPVIGMRIGSLDLDVFENREGKLELETESVRCRYALSYGDWQTVDGGFPSRASDVRNAFNSPFRPFVLATTSVGQEGLDFHKYCHSIFHWNLPRNPVDLEQREGRIHRYKGHVIRKNVASKASILTSNTNDPWQGLFEMVKSTKQGEANDLIPYWIFEGEFSVDRYAPLIPFSKDEELFFRLLKSLATYRLAFGQPRQEELLEALDGSGLLEDLEKSKSLLINLAP